MEGVRPGPCGGIPPPPQASTPLHTPSLHTHLEHPGLHHRLEALDHLRVQAGSLHLSSLSPGATSGPGSPIKPASPVGPGGLL